MSGTENFLLKKVSIFYSISAVESGGSKKNGTENRTGTDLLEPEPNRNRSSGTGTEPEPNRNRSSGTETEPEP